VKGRDRTRHSGAGPRMWRKSTSIPAVEVRQIGEAVREKRGTFGVKGHKPITIGFHTEWQVTAAG
jgi:hypothetical protein